MLEIEGMNRVALTMRRALLVTALTCTLGCEAAPADPSGESTNDGPATSEPDASVSSVDGGPRRPAPVSDAQLTPRRDAGEQRQDARTPDAPAGGGSARDAAAASPGTPGDAATSTTENDAGSARPLPPVSSVDTDGPFKTQQTLTGGPKKASGVFRPVELGKDGLRHPIFLFGCGGSSKPSNYVDHMNRLASHGFVAVAEVSLIDGNGVTLEASLDWIIAENARPDSEFYQKLDTSRIAMGGHSIGSVNTFSVANDPRLLTTIHIAGGSLDNMGTDAKKLTHPTAFIYSESDTFGNVEKAEADYKVTTAPVFFTIMSGVDHIAAARQGLPAVVAWLRWHLGGETERRAMFLDPTGEFCRGKFVSRSKNW